MQICPECDELVDELDTCIDCGATRCDDCLISHQDRHLMGEKVAKYE
jgi:hypothetical protein